MYNAQAGGAQGAQQGDYQQQSAGNDASNGGKDNVTDVDYEEVK
jgi:hypothetical protein